MKSDFQYFKITQLERVRKRKTVDFDIVSKSSGDVLGAIMYYNRWRQHIFISNKDVYWNEQCLNDVSEFLRELKK